jgi:hypothetical protein
MKARMVPTLGKRKRETADSSRKARIIGSERSDSLELDAKEIFRRHFEAQFKPLPSIRKPTKVTEQESEDVSEEESEWDGLSEDGDGKVQVIEHTDAQSRMAAMSKEELKTFMVSCSSYHAGQC